MRSASSATSTTTLALTWQWGTLEGSTISGNNGERLCAFRAMPSSCAQFGLLA
jgi:hypothetical protein